MAKKTSQDYFWALTIGGIVYLFVTLVGVQGFLSWMIAGSAFSWALKGDKDEQEEEAESMIRPPREWSDIKKKS